MNKPQFKIVKVEWPGFATRYKILLRKYWLGLIPYYGHLEKWDDDLGDDTIMWFETEQEAQEFISHGKNPQLWNASIFTP